MADVLRLSSDPPPCLHSVWQNTAVTPVDWIGGVFKAEHCFEYLG